MPDDGAQDDRGRPAPSGASPEPTAGSTASPEPTAGSAAPSGRAGAGDGGVGKLVGGLSDRRVRVGVLVALTLLAGVFAVALTRGGTLPEEPRAAAVPVIAATVPPDTEPTTTEAPPDTAPPETAPPEVGPPATLPPPNPGPPVYPTTGAQAQAGPVTIYNAPYGAPIRTLSNPFGPLPSHPAFRVIGTQAGGWLQVQLPTRPNGSTGWIKAADVTQFTTNLSIDVDLNARVITIYDRDQVIHQGPVVVGTDYWPTPVGDFYITDLIPNPGGAYGAYAFGLSAHSSVFTEFAGGDGQVALHGTNQPGLMGTASSHGCVRLTNDLASRLGKLATIGLPVRIHKG